MAPKTHGPPSQTSDREYTGCPARPGRGHSQPDWGHRSGKLCCVRCRLAGQTASECGSGLGQLTQTRQRDGATWPSFTCGCTATGWSATPRTRPQPARPPVQSNTRRPLWPTDLRGLKVFSVMN
jgi:hypothetical protein